MRPSTVFGMKAMYINVHDAAHGLTGLADGVLLPAVSFAGKATFESKTPRGACVSRGATGVYANKHNASAVICNPIFNTTVTLSSQASIADPLDSATCLTRLPQSGLTRRKGVRNRMRTDDVMVH
jgi:hypothetical protein